MRLSIIYMPRPAFAVLSAFVLLVIAVVAACGNEPAEPADGKITVVTTTYPLTFMARRIGGDRVSVVQLIKPGTEAHDFEPVPSDVRTIASADIFFYNHPAFEPWALAVATASGSGPGGTAQSNAIQTVNLESEGEDHGGNYFNNNKYFCSFFAIICFCPTVLILRKNSLLA